MDIPLIKTRREILDLLKKTGLLPYQRFSKSDQIMWEFMKTAKTIARVAFPKPVIFRI